MQHVFNGPSIRCREQAARPANRYRWLKACLRAFAMPHNGLLMCVVEISNSLSQGVSLTARLIAFCEPRCGMNYIGFGVFARACEGETQCHWRNWPRLLFPYSMISPYAFSREPRGVTVNFWFCPWILHYLYH